MRAAHCFGLGLSLALAFFVVQSGYAVESGFSALPFGGAFPVVSNVPAVTPYTTGEGVQFIRAPMPKYPRGTSHLKARALIQLQLDRQTGRVLAVSLLQSTGQPVLDRAVVDTLKEWRARPGIKVDHVNIPVVFTGHSRTG